MLGSPIITIARQDLGTLVQFYLELSSEGGTATALSLHLFQMMNAILWHNDQPFILESNTSRKVIPLNRS